MQNLYVKYYVDDGRAGFLKLVASAVDVGRAGFLKPVALAVDVVPLMRQRMYRLLLM